MAAFFTDETLEPVEFKSTWKRERYSIGSGLNHGHTKILRHHGTVGRAKAELAHALVTCETGAM